MILSTRRSGSTWLNCVLGSHRGVANLGEYFRPFEKPGHVACRLCEADGLPQCRVLHGIECVPAERAYAFAAERLGCSVLIECSKLLHWPLLFIDQPDLDVRFIHLVRNPCGYIESEQRRRPEATTEALIAEWTEQNGHIETFVRNAGRPNVLVSYERLATAPHAAFPELCAFLGFAFDPAALAYWRFEHHGLGGNGACSLYLRGRAVQRFTTGDDAFYDTLVGAPTRADERWRGRIGDTVKSAAFSTPYAREMQSRLGVRWSED
jgi:hypothetical protein